MLEVNYGFAALLAYSDIIVTLEIALWSPYILYYAVYSVCHFDDQSWYFWRFMTQNYCLLGFLYTTLETPLQMF